MTKAGIPQSWKVLVPLGLVLLVIAHAIALVFRIQPAVSLWFPPSGVAIALTLWLGPLGAVLTGLASMVMAPFWGNDGWFRLAAWTDATEPLVAWWLYRHYWQGSLCLQRFRDAATFILSAPIFACATIAKTRLGDAARKQPETSNATTPAIALTAYAAQTDKQKALAAGFQKHITKPVDLDRLLEAVVWALAHSTTLTL